MIICGGDYRPGSRGTDCPNSVHDYPLPNGYVDAGEVAAHRLYKGWSNPRCPECKIYGWRPSNHIEPDCCAVKKENP